MTSNEKQVHLVDGDVPLARPNGSIGDEKGVEPVHLDHLEDFLAEDVRAALDLSPEEQKRIWRKVDMHIIWPMALIYLLQYSDKSVIGNAKIEGLLTELHISSSQYTWVLSIFYFSYGLFEMPSNLLLKKFKASYWMSGLCLAFGLNLALMGLSKSYAGLLVARLALGFTTAGVYPGAAYYFSTWYPRPMMAFRFSFFFCSATFAGAFAGLLASAIRNLHGKLGHQGWSWIFIIFGCLAILGGFITFPFIHKANSPEEATFLTDREKAFVKACLAKDAGYTRTAGETTRLNFKEWKAVFVDWQTYSWTFQYFCSCTPLFSLAIFVPSIITGLGYKGTQAQLLGVPTFASAIPFVILSAWLSDKYKKRGYVMAVGYTTALIGWIMLLKCETTGARYAGTFIVSIGQWPISAPSVMATTNSFAGQTKRATAVGLICGVGNLCGIITAQIFRTEWAPRYIPAIHGMICFNVMGLAQTLVLLYVYKAINARRQRICDKGINFTHEELQAMGDKAPTFRYIF